MKRSFFFELMKLPPDLDDRPPYRGPNWPFILILAAYAAFFTWLIVR